MHQRRQQAPAALTTPASLCVTCSFRACKLRSQRVGVQPGWVLLDAFRAHLDHWLLGWGAGTAPRGGTGPVTWEACTRNVGTSEPQRGNISPYRGPSEAPAGTSSPHHSCLTVCDVLTYSLQVVNSVHWHASEALAGTSSSHHSFLTVRDVLIYSLQAIN